MKRPVLLLSAVAVAWMMAVIVVVPQMSRCEFPKLEMSREDSLFLYIDAAAKKHGLNLQLVHSVIYVESRWQQRAVSPMGALGLMQIMLDTARDVMGDPNVTKEMLLDPFYNVEVGTKYLAWLLKFYDGNLDLALTAYNRGVGRVEKLRAEGQDPDNGYKDLVFGVL